VIDQVNTSRAHMQGVNGTRIPDGNVTVNKNGSLSVQTAQGGKYGLRANGTLESCGNPSSSVNFHPNGRVSSVSTPSMSVNRGIWGNRTITSRQADGSVLTSTGSNRGYLARNVTAGGQNFTQHIQSNNGKVSNLLYTRFKRGAADLLNYTSAQYYPPEFYAWAYNPWDSPIQYQWGWLNDAWYTSASSYFTPNAQYNSGAEWLTDYVLAQVVSSAPADDTADAAPNPVAPNPVAPNPDDANQTGTQTPITPELKAAIADDVRRYLQHETSAAAGITPAPLPFATTFIIGATSDYTLADQTTCTLSPGSIVQLPAPAADDAASYALLVISSRRSDCQASQMLTIGVADMQGFANTFHAEIDEGLGVLRANQGQYGLPAAPAQAMGNVRARVAGLNDGLSNLLSNGSGSGAGNGSSSGLSSVLPNGVGNGLNSALSSGLLDELPGGVGSKLSSMLSGLRQDAGRTESATTASVCPSQPAGQP